MNLRQNLKDLQNHTDYSFKNKQLFREKQNKFADVNCNNINSLGWKCF